jgi:hypothetical protein
MPERAGQRPRRLLLRRRGRADPWHGLGPGPRPGVVPVHVLRAPRRSADDLAHWRGDGGAAVAIERGGELAAFAYRRGKRIGPAAGRDETALLQAVAVAAAAGAGGGRNVTMRVPGACASLLEALVSCGFRIGDPTLFMASQLFGRPELYLPSGPILY